ncbi:MAG: uncharacterized protein QG588_1800 [Candidatus Poribacteria bacterium]|nr:uncharacterized protein [Candidatus Poribacteria bacterium]
MRKFTIILALSLVVFYACEGTENITLNPTAQNQMQVIGSATIKKAPDMAVSQIGVQTINKELDPAINENNSKAAAIIDALKQMGIADKDIQTTSFNIYPQRDYANNKPNEIIGYQVDNMLSVNFRDLTKIGTGLQRAVNAGANNIYGISFTFADPTSLQDEARIEAIKDATKKAKSMADAAGIKLGKIISINELTSSSIISRVDYSKAEASAAVPVESGEIGLTVQVQIVYSLD